MASSLPDPTSALATFTRAGSTHPREIPVLSPRVRIGQGAQSDVVLDDDSVSTSHASLEFLAGGWQLTDLGSKNGTFVNGERIAANLPVALADGDAVAFGALRVAFSSRDPSETENTASAFTPPPPTPSPLRPAGFRLPLWVLVLVLLLLAIVFAVVFLTVGEPAPVDPVLQPVVELFLPIDARFTA